MFVFSLNYSLLHAITLLVPPKRVDLVLLSDKSWAFYNIMACSFNVRR